MEESTHERSDFNQETSPVPGSKHFILPHRENYHLAAKLYSGPSESMGSCSKALGDGCLR